MPLVDLRAVSKAFITPAGAFYALREVNLQVGAGEFVAVVGKSGSGKSTLINMIAGIDHPTRGEVWINGNPIHHLSENRLAAWRGRNLGIIFQFFQLLPTLTTLENIMLPMDFCHRYPFWKRKAVAQELLRLVELEDQADKLPAALSGGQQQRVAIARALANNPPLLVADEPTGNLDSQTAQAVFALFQALVTQGKTVIMVTHDQELARSVPRSIFLRDGQVVFDSDIHPHGITAAVGRLQAEHWAASFQAGGSQPGKARSISQPGKDQRVKPRTAKSQPAKTGAGVPQRSDGKGPPGPVSPAAPTQAHSPSKPLPPPVGNKSTSQPLTSSIDVPPASAKEVAPLPQPASHPGSPAESFDAPAVTPLAEAGVGGAKHKRGETTPPKGERKTRPLSPSAGPKTAAMMLQTHIAAILAERQTAVEKLRQEFARVADDREQMQLTYEAVLSEVSQAAQSAEQAGNFDEARGLWAILVEATAPWAGKSPGQNENQYR